MSAPVRYEVDETTLVFAFRYALGRRTAAPSHVVTELRKHWATLTPFTQSQIQREIRNEMAVGDVGDACDAETWNEVLGWVVRA